VTWSEDADREQGENEENETSEPEPEAAEQGVVPGADLEPIAIGEERELTAEERAAREAEEEERRAREAAAADDDDEAIAPRPISVPADTRIQATGKRKSAVARVIVRAGDGSFEINDRDIAEYFKGSQHQALARQPLVTAGYEGAVDVKVRVHGGGISGQAGAVRHGVARALTALEPELRGDLKRRGMLTRDDRRKERKKAGLKKARKRPQFSKR
jgi:small subunit ribosomal protein S9